MTDKLNRRWHDDVEELHKIVEEEMAMAGADDLEALAAESNEDETRELTSLQIVQLSKERAAEYKGFFFPSSKNDLIGLFEDLANVTLRVNAFFGFMRSILVNGRHIFTLENDKQALTDYVNSLLAKTIASDVNNANVVEDATVFLRAFIDGANHTIVRPH